MFWDANPRGVDESEEITEILEFKSSRFHGAQAWGPMVNVRFLSDGGTMWVFADEVFVRFPKL